MIPFTVYDPSTGRILRSGHCLAESLALQPLAGEAVVALPSNDAIQYVNVAALTVIERPAVAVADMSVSADGVEHTVATGLPSGTWVRISAGDGFEVDDGQLDLTFTEPGSYVIEVWPPFPYRLANFLVTAS